MIELDTNHFEVDDIYVVVHVDLFPGDPVDDFTEPGKQFIRAMAIAGYWPVDFGEGDRTHISVWFKRARDGLDAMKLAESFIACGGDV